MIEERTLSDRAGDVEKKENQGRGARGVEEEREAGSYCTLNVSEAEPPPYNGTGGIRGIIHHVFSFPLILALFTFPLIFSLLLFCRHETQTRQR